MVSFMNATPAWLLVLTALTGGLTVCVAAHTDGIPRDVKRSECYSSDFIKSQTSNCFRQQRLFNNKLFREPEIPSFASWIDSFNQDICRTNNNQRQMTEAYRCVFNLIRRCLNQFRADAVETGDYDSRGILQDMELYMPDPDLFVDAIQHACRNREVDLLCLMDQETRLQLLFCGIHEFEKFEPYAKEIQTSNTFQAMNGFKLAICTIFNGFQHCAEDHMLRCPRKTVSFLTTLLNYLTPPVCHYNDATRTSTGMDQGKTGKEKSRFHDEV